MPPLEVTKTPGLGRIIADAVELGTMADQEHGLKALGMMSFFSRSTETVQYRGVDVPGRFAVVAEHPEWPSKVELIIVVDPDTGPVLAGVEATDGRVTMREATDAIADTVGTDEVLTAATAWVASELAALRVLGVDVDLSELTDEQRTRFFAVRDTTWSRVLPVVRPQRRRVLSRDHLRQVAQVYRDAYAAGKPPTIAVAEHFTVSHRTATRWVAEARKVGALRPAKGRRPGEAPEVATQEGGAE